MTLDADLLASAQIMADPLWQDNLVPGMHETNVVGIALLTLLQASSGWVKCSHTVPTITRCMNNFLP
jgi:hypothetical protein